MKNLIKNASLIGLLLLGVACKGPEGKPGMQMTSCDAAKQEVKQILTGKSKSCSGFTKSAITTGEAEEVLQETWMTETGVVVTIENDSFYSIFEVNGKVVALRGKIELSEDSNNDDETLNIKTLLGDMTMGVGTMTFGEEEIIFTDDFGPQTMSIFNADTDRELNDEDIIIVRTAEDLNKI